MGWEDKDIVIGNVTYSGMFGKVERSEIKQNKNGETINCVWYTPEDGITGKKSGTMYIEYPNQPHNGAKVRGEEISLLNKATIKGSDKSDDIWLTDCYNCNVDVSNFNNTKNEFDYVRVNRGENNTVKSGNNDSVIFHNGTRLIKDYSFTSGIFNQEKGKIR